jgi:hypothetical protein
MPPKKSQIVDEVDEEYTKMAAAADIAAEAAADAAADKDDDEDAEVEEDEEEDDDSLEPSSDDEEKPKKKKAESKGSKKAAGAGAGAGAPTKGKKGSSSSSSAAKKSGSGGSSSSKIISSSKSGPITGMKRPAPLLSSGPPKKQSTFGISGISSSSSSSSFSSSSSSSAQASTAAAAAAAVPQVRISTQADADAHVLAYFRKLNRPFSKIILDANLHGLIPPKMLTASLTNLVAAGSLLMKEFGQSVIYWPEQSWFGESSAEAVAQASLMAQAEAQRAKAANVRMRVALANYNSEKDSMTDAQIDEELAEVTAGNAALEAKLSKLAGAMAAAHAAAGGGGGGSGGGGVLDPKRKEKLIASLDRYKKAWRDRKRQATEVIDLLCEESGKRPKDMLALIGVETDADAKVDIKDI